MQKKCADAHNEASSQFSQTSSPKNRLLPLRKHIVSVAQTSQLILLREIIDDYIEWREILI